MEFVAFPQDFQDGPWQDLVILDLQKSGAKRQNGTAGYVLLKQVNIRRGADVAVKGDTYIADRMHIGANAYQRLSNETESTETTRHLRSGDDGP